MTHILNVGYSSTNYYAIGSRDVPLLVDVGWPGTLPKLRANYKRLGLPFDGLRWLLCTHYHPDHAGLAQELKGLGVLLVALEEQIPAIGPLKGLMKPSDGYQDIVLADIQIITAADSRSFLTGLGLAGEIILTRGHSDDSISLVLDEGAAFTGDLPPSGYSAPESAALVDASWSALRALGARQIYPGHGPSRPASESAA